MKRVIVSILPRMREADADGSPCIICGDAVFMNAAELIVIQKRTGQEVGKLEGQFCQSCSQVFDIEWIDR